VLGDRMARLVGGCGEAVEQALEPVGEFGVAGALGQAACQRAGGRELVGRQAVVQLARVGALVGVALAGGPPRLERDVPGRVGEQRQVGADGVGVAEPCSREEREAVLAQPDRLRPDLGGELR
jgi:hypothetical protein